MNFENIGKNFANVVIKVDKRKPIIHELSISDEMDDKSPKTSFESIELKEKNESIQLIPFKYHERDVLYISGASGSGKSYFTKKYIIEYHKMFPKNQIYLFSSLTTDETLDDLKYINRIKIDDDFLESNLTVDDFKSTLVIFDDIDCLNDKKKLAKVTTYLNMLLETGRHASVSVVYTSHLATAGLATRRILNEAHAIVFFPKKMGAGLLRYLLDKYIGLDKEQRKKINNLPSRWVAYYKNTYPATILYEKGCYILKTLDDD